MLPGRPGGFGSRRGAGTTPRIRGCPAANESFHRRPLVPAPRWRRGPRPARAGLAGRYHGGPIRAGVAGGDPPRPPRRRYVASRCGRPDLFGARPRPSGAAARRTRAHQRTPHPCRARRRGHGPGARPRLRGVPIARVAREVRAGRCLTPGAGTPSGLGEGQRLRRAGPSPAEDSLGSSTPNGRRFDIR